MAKRGYESNKTGGKVDELLDKIDNLNVPNWALQKNKPSYTAQEVHALPENTPIPTVPQNVSAFNNDAGYLTSHQDISDKEDKSNKVTSLSVHNTDTQYPSAKAVFDNLSTKQDTINDLGFIRSGASEGANSYQVTGDKEYNAFAFSGLGRKNLTKNVVGEKNVLTQAMMSAANTIYVIQYDYDLNGQTITVPAGCVLQFEGGSISNGGIVGNNTYIVAGIVKILGLDVTFGGSWKVSEIYPEWFGAIGDGTTDDSLAFQKCFDNVKVLGDKIKVTKLSYSFDSTLYIKSRINLEIRNKTILHYYGTSHFIVLGDPQDNQEMSGMIKGGLFQAHNSESEDVFHIIWAVGITFDSVTTRQGRNGFNTNHSDFRGAYYTYFVKCRVEWARENGFKLLKGSSGQVNQIQFIRCSSSGNGNPVYGQRTNTPDYVNGNGFIVGGTAISFIGCASEANNGYGIKFPDDYATSGATVDVLYTEQNLLGPFYIGKADNSTGKGSISIKGVYNPTTVKPTIVSDKWVCKNRSIYYDSYYNMVPDNEFKSSCSSFNEAINIIKSKIDGVKLPCNLSYNRTGSGSYAYITLGMILGGKIYRINQGSISNTTIVSRLVSSISEDTITLDDAVPVGYDYCNIVSMGHPLYFLDKSILQKYPLTLTVWSPNTQDPTVKIKCTSFNNDRTSFTLNNDMKKYWGLVKAGDVVYFGNSSGTSYWIVGTISLGNRTFICKLPDALASHPLYNQFCCVFLTGLTWDNTQINALCASTTDSICHGTFADRPTANIYVGFRYFCTDMQTTEGATDGIEIIHKGNNVWVDALGRTVS